MAQANRPRLTVAQVHTPLTAIPTLADALVDKSSKIGVHELLTQFAERSDGRTWECTVPRRRSRRAPSAETVRSPNVDLMDTPKRSCSRSPDSTRRARLMKEEAAVDESKTEHKKESSSRAKRPLADEEDDVDDKPATPKAGGARKRLKFEGEEQLTDDHSKGKEEQRKKNSEPNAVSTSITSPNISPEQERRLSKKLNRVPSPGQPLQLFPRLLQLQQCTTVADNRYLSALYDDSLNDAMFPLVPPHSVPTPSPPTFYGEPRLSIPTAIHLHSPLPEPQSDIHSPVPMHQPITDSSWVGSASDDQIVDYLRTMPSPLQSDVENSIFTYGFAPLSTPISSHLMPRHHASPMLYSPFGAGSDIGAPTLQRLLTPMSASSSHPSSPFPGVESETFTSIPLDFTLHFPLHPIFPHDPLPVSSSSSTTLAIPTHQAAKPPQRKTIRKP